MHFHLAGKRADDAIFILLNFPCGWYFESMPRANRRSPGKELQEGKEKHDMPDDNAEKASPVELSESERGRIRAEMRYALLAARESVPDEKAKSRFAFLTGLTGNGFVLLLAGSLITYYLVPHFQRIYENHQQQSNSMHECLQQFLLYGNSIWEEFFTILPLTQESEIGKDQYTSHLNEIAKIKLTRYNSLVKVKSLALVFRQNSGNSDTAIDSALSAFALQLDSVSHAIDNWIIQLYCTPTSSGASPCATFDATFDPFAEYNKIKDIVTRVGNDRSNEVAGLMVKRINSIGKGGL
jgi:hypothetical protein